LNEWVALDDPGHYTLYVTTGRVSRRGPTKDEPLQLRSNSLEFDVVAASPEWQEQTLAAAVSFSTLLRAPMTKTEKQSEGCVFWTRRGPSGNWQDRWAISQRGGDSTA
jgi:hypothetical protein